jgi:hypothetical protein
MNLVILDAMTPRRGWGPTDVYHLPLEMDSSGIWISFRVSPSRNFGFAKLPHFAGSLKLIISALFVHFYDSFSGFSKV